MAESLYTYGDTPWPDFETNQRTVYVPDLLEVFRRNSIFYGMVDYSVDLLAYRTNQIVFTQPIDPEPNIAELGLRDLWLPQLYMDSRSITITATRYGDKIAMHKYDDYITYWRENRVAGMRKIVRRRLGPHIVSSLDRLARNEFLRNINRTFAGGASGFASLEADDTFEIGITRAVQLGADYSPDPVRNPVFCVTSPAAKYTIRNDANGEFISRLTYANPPRLINGEVGVYEGVVFSIHPDLTLWNCGTVLAQTTITTAIQRGDGSPDPNTTKVDDVWQTGQPGATHYIQVASVTGFSVGDYVTLHTARPSANSEMAVQDGVQWDHPYNRERRIVAIDTTNNRLSFDYPILDDYYQTDLGGGVYGYVTKARPVHAALFIKGPRAVVAGVIQPPQTYEPTPFDDTGAVYRASWDAYMKYQQFYNHRAEVYFFAGPVRVNNEVVNL